MSLFDKKWLQTTLLRPPKSWGTMIGKQQQLHTALIGTELGLSRIGIRLLQALLAHDAGEVIGVADLLVLIRQATRQYGPLEFPLDVWDSIPDKALHFGLQLRIGNTPDTVLIIALDWSPDWLSDASTIDQLVGRRTYEPVLGDGVLYDFMRTGGKAITTYQTEGQRQAVWAAQFAAPGSTTLITLPTGAGKSMAVYLPAWVTSQRGQGGGKTTIVIVPTVALAIDQNETARQHFKNTDPYHQPYYLAGDTSDTERKIIREGVRRGTIPIVFMSPESLIKSEFRHIIHEATANNRIDRIVVDEAHLIETWGASFRTDFQFLSTYFRRLYEASNGTFRLTMLSATISPPALVTLKQLFTLPSQQFYHIQVNQLRPEISYWMVDTPNYWRKRDHVREALRHLPRPAIVYFTKPDDAEDYKDWLVTEEGYRRIATFTGNTPANLRLNLVQEWRDDQIDLMIATSAFGLGVDKPDVRTIIHAAFPESLDRFYQEVGRGGRDGCSSLSLMVTTERDRKMALSMSKTSRISSKKAWLRWEAMLHNSWRSLNGQLVVNRSITPKGDMIQSEINRDWNDHVLLLMQRAEIIRVTDLSSELVDEDSQTATYDLLPIEILRHDVVNHKQDFFDAFEQARKQELEQLIVASNHLYAIFTHQVNDATQCLAYGFEEVYAPVGLACGGCPSCRSQQQPPYATSMELEINADIDMNHNNPVPRLGDVEKLMRHQSVLQLIYDSDEALRFDVLEKLITGLVRRGVMQVLLSNNMFDLYAAQLVEQLKSIVDRPHMLFTSGQLDMQLFPLPLLAFLNVNDKQSDRVYRQLQRWQTDTHAQLIYVLPRSLRLNSLHGLFTDRVNGHQENLDHFLKQLRILDYTL